MKDKIIIENTQNPQILEVNVGFNLRINPSLKFIIEGISGVEELDTFGVDKYSFHVQFGKAFDENEIRTEIKEKIYEFLSE